MKKVEVFLCITFLLSSLSPEIHSYSNEPPTDSQNRPRISVWAKKAGGNLKPEYLAPISPPPEPPAAEPQSEIISGEGEREEQFNAILNPMPTVPFPAKTTPGPVITTSTTSTTKSPSIGSPNFSQPSKDYGYSYENSDEEKCPEDQFYHIRGQRCVPIQCPVGTSKRNTHTGECIDLFVGWGSRGRRRMYPYARNRYNAKQWPGKLPRTTYNAREQNR